MSNLLLAVLLSLGIISTPDMVREMSIREGVDPALASCIVQAESNWNPRLVSKDMDSGLFQIIPSTAKWVAEQMGLQSYDLMDPVTNAEMGVWILKRYPEWYATIDLCQ